MATNCSTAQRVRWIPTGLAITLSAFASHAADFTLVSGQVAGGGGASSGGSFRLTGTIAQADAGGPLTNALFSLQGGFWALPLLIQTGDAPTLSVTNGAPGFAVIGWTPATPGFVLQSTDSLAPTHWVEVVGATTPPVTVPATLPRRYYRLVRP